MITLNSPSNLVAQCFAGDDSNFFTNSLVDVEVIAKSGVVLFNDDSSGLFHRLGPDSTLRTNDR